MKIMSWLEIKRLVVCDKMVCCWIVVGTWKRGLLPQKILVCRYGY